MHGKDNWMLLFFIIFVANLVIDNYLSYGIIKDPIQITYSFITFIKDNWWMYGVLFLSYLFQVVLCFFNEKLLSLKILPEKIGMTLHVFNFLFLFNFSAFLFKLYDFNPVAAVAISVHIFHMSIKFWGYAFRNMVLRTEYLKKSFENNYDIKGKSAVQDKDGVNGFIKYPDNVTLRNIFTFMVCTGTCTYNIKPSKRKSADFGKLFVGIFKAIGIHYGVAFLMYQYLIPEADKAVLYVSNMEYLKILGSLLKLAFPIHIVWLQFFYYYCFVCYLPAFEWTWGIDDVVVGEDWWNSENTTIFWTKWNYQVHIWFKECFFLPLLRAGYSKRHAAFVVALVSGILHEYLLSFPCRTGYGLPMLVMVLQIPLAYITSAIAKRFGNKWGNMIVWMSFVFGHSVTVIFVYYAYMNQ